MSNKFIKRICWIPISLVVFLVILAMCWTPLKTVHYCPREDDLVLELDYKEVDNTHSCKVGNDGVVSITGGDAFIIFSDLSCKGQTIAIHFDKVLDSKIPVQLFLDYGKGFNEKDTYKRTTVPGEEYLAFTVKAKKFKALRIDMDTEYDLKDVEIHSKKPAKVYQEQENKWLRISAAVLISIIIILALFFCDKKFNFVDKLIQTIYKYKLDIAVAIVLFIGFLLAMIFSPYNRYALALVFGALAILISFVLERKRISKNPEYLFLRLIIIIGLLMVIEQPFGHTCWDLDSHYKWVLESASFGDTAVTDTDNSIMFNRQKFLDLPQTGADNKAKIKLLNESGKYAINVFDWDFSLPHLPYGMCMAVLRLFGLSYYWIFTLARIPSLFIYALAIFFGMRRLHSGKMILATVALFPTSIFIACNYTYDYWVTCFSLLGVAYFVGMCQEKDKAVEIKDCIIMYGALVLANIPKPIYAPLMILPFFMPWSKIKNKKKYYALCVAAFAALLLFLIIKSLGVTASGGDTRGGAVDTMGQITFIFTNLGAYIRILINFMKWYLSPDTMNQYISHFAYLGIASYTAVYKVIMLVVAVTDKNEYDVKSYSILSRVYSLLMFLGTVALIATAMYIAFTPVGFETIGGCQPRYIIPLIYPLISIILGGGLYRIVKIMDNKYVRATYNYVIFLFLVGVLYLDVYNMMYLKVR